MLHCCCNLVVLPGDLTIFPPCPCAPLQCLLVLPDKAMVPEVCSLETRMAAVSCSVDDVIADLGRVLELKWWLDHQYKASKEASDVDDQPQV